LSKVGPSIGHDASLDSRNCPLKIKNSQFIIDGEICVLDVQSISDFNKRPDALAPRTERLKDACSIIGAQRKTE